MTEVPLSFSGEFSQFDAQEAGKALGAEPRSTRDVAHGDGQALDVNDSVLEIYPNAGIARVTTQDARIELFRVPSYTVTGERVVFEQGEGDDRKRLLVRGDGRVSLYPVLRAPEPSRTRQTAARGRQDSPAPRVPSETPTAPNAHPNGDKSGEVEQTRLQGRLGRDPWFRSEGEQHIAGFPLAVNDPENRTTWHKVVVFDATADQLHEAYQKGSVRKGRLVDVTGQTVVREEPRANGGVKKNPEFHASAVARVQSSRPER
jgi:hypothetical protein